MIERSDYAEGERVKVGCYVDEGVYQAFRSWVEEQTGKQYAEVGRALERAMLEYMDDDRIQDQLSAIDAQTQKNEALLRKVIDRIENTTVEKESGKTNPRVPSGKDPGDRKLRELRVIEALCKTEGEKFQKDTIEQAIEEVASVSSQKTIRSYVESITDTQAFVSANAVGQWYIDRGAATELLKRNGIEIEGEP